jgi:transcription factor IIIB subunit 2
VSDGYASGGRRSGTRLSSYDSSSHEQSLARGRTEIEDVAEKLGVRPREDLCNAAARLYKLAVQRNFTRGRRVQQVAGACLYIVCRQENKPFMLIDFSDMLQTNVYVLGAVFLQLCRLLRLEQHPLFQKPVDPSLFIHRFADRLDFKKKMHAVANTALRLVASMKRDWMQTGASNDSDARVANRNLRFGHGGDRKWRLNDGQIPNVRGMRVARGTGYNRVKENRRAS